MTNTDFFLLSSIMIILFGFNILAIDHSDKKIITAIQDNGCASDQPPTPEYKQRIKTYNHNSLKGNN